MHAENPSQVRQVKKDYQDFIEKYKKDMKEKDAEIQENTKKVLKKSNFESYVVFRAKWQNREFKLYRIRFEF